MATASLTEVISSRTSLRFKRAVVVAIAAAAAVATFLAIEVMGFNLRTPIMGNGQQFDIGPGNVALVSTFAGIAGWLTLAVIEKITGKARRIWTILALTALGLSFGGPFSGSGLAIEERLGLTILHMVVAAVLILGLRKTANRHLATIR